MFFICIFIFSFFFCDGKAKFLAAITPVFSVKEISLFCWFGAQKNIIITNVEISCAAYFFSGKCEFFLYSFMNRK